MCLFGRIFHRLVLVCMFQTLSIFLYLILLVLQHSLCLHLCVTMSDELAQCMVGVFWKLFLNQNGWQ